MAVRYVEIGQYPDVRREVRGNLSEILVAAANPGTYAAPEDVTGCFLEMGLDGKWTGASVGTMSKATADALYASGALTSLAVGTPYRDTAGTSYSYQGPGVGWSPASCGPIYNGTTLPFPVGGDCIRIRAANPAVPKGWSWLEWTGTIFAPPAGEPIAMIWRKASPVALVTPGNTALTVIYQSPVIPDYMTPANLKMIIRAAIAAKNPSGVSGCALMLAVSGSVPTSPVDYNYPFGGVFTPNAVGNGLSATGGGANKVVNAGYISVRNGRDYFSFPINGQSIEASQGFPFVTGENKAYVMAQPSGIGDQIQLDGYSIVSEGNL